MCARLVLVTPDDALTLEQFFPSSLLSSRFSLSTLHLASYLNLFPPPTSSLPPLTNSILTFSLTTTPGSRISPPCYLPWDSTAIGAFPQDRTLHRRKPSDLRTYPLPNRLQPDCPFVSLPFTSFLPSAPSQTIVHPGRKPSDLRTYPLRNRLLPDCPFVSLPCTSLLSQGLSSRIRFFRLFFGFRLEKARMRSILNTILVAG